VVGCQLKNIHVEINSNLSKTLKSKCNRLVNRSNGCFRNKEGSQVEYEVTLAKLNIFCKSDINVHCLQKHTFYVDYFKDEVEVRNMIEEC
jgi:hypothetical protein